LGLSETMPSSNPSQSFTLVLPHIVSYPCSTAAEVFREYSK
jgi:hypothetical protein